MVLGRLRKEEQNKMMGSIDPTIPPPSFADAMKAIAAFANSPDAVKKELVKLAARIEAAEKAEATAKVERQNLAEAQRKYEEDYAAAKAKHHADLDKRDAASLARDDSRSKALDARENALHQRELEAESLLAKAKEAYASVRKGIDELDRHMTVRLA
jgi:predicted  nucleic acid-binding Zn-ribbon protein